MIMYLAGNFPQMLDKKMEKETYELILNKYGRYERLLAFYYKKESTNVLEVKNEINTLI